MFLSLRIFFRDHSYVLQSTMDHNQESFLHFSILNGTSPGIFPTCFDPQVNITAIILICFEPQGIIIRNHSYMFRSTIDHIQVCFLHVSIHKGSSSVNITTVFDPHCIIIRDHSYMFRSTRTHHQVSFLHFSIHKGLSSWYISTGFDTQGIIIRDHSYMFLSIRDHNQGSLLNVSIHKVYHQGSFLHVSIHKWSSSGNITTCYGPWGFIIRDHPYMFRSIRFHHRGSFLHFWIIKWS